MFPKISSMLVTTMTSDGPPWLISTTNLTQSHGTTRMNVAVTCATMCHLPHQPCTWVPRQATPPQLLQPTRPQLSLPYLQKSLIVSTNSSSSPTRLEIQQHMNGASSTSPFVTPCLFIRPPCKTGNFLLNSMLHTIMTSGTTLQISASGYNIVSIPLQNLALWMPTSSHFLILLKNMHCTTIWCLFIVG
jgi:hypothetical protein